MVLKILQSNLQLQHCSLRYLPAHAIVRREMDEAPCSNNSVLTPTDVEGQIKFKLNASLHDGHRISPSENRRKGTDLEEDRRDSAETN